MPVSSSLIRWLPSGFAKGLTTRWLSVSWVWCTYLRTLLYPVDLSCDWSGKSIALVKSFTDPRSVAVLVLWASLGTAVPVLAFDGCRWPRACRSARLATACGLAFGIVPFFLSSNAAVTVGFMKAERVMYLPALGFCQAIVALLMGLVGDCEAPVSSPHQKRLSEVLGDWKGNWLDSPYAGCHAAAVRATPDKLPAGSNCQPSTLRSCLMASVLVVLASYYGQRCIERNLDWSSGIRIWESAYKVNPHTLHTRYNYGLELHWVARHHDSVNILESVVEERPEDHSARFAFGVSLFNIRRCMEAEETVKNGLEDVEENVKWKKLSPKKHKEMAHVRGNYIGALGLIATCKNDFSKAGKLFYRAIEVDPGNEFAISHGNQLLELAEKMRKQQEMIDALPPAQKEMVEKQRAKQQQQLA